MPFFAIVLLTWGPTLASNCVAEASPELPILLPLPPKFWDCKYVLPCLEHVFYVCIPLSRTQSFVHTEFQMGGWGG